MEFPPPPPEYTRILLVRWSLAAWAMVGVAILIFRMQRWKSIRSYEIALWLLAAGISGFVAMLVEACGSQIIWTEPRDVDVAAQPTGINLRGARPGHSSGWLSSYHQGGVNVVMADGSARFLSATIDPAVLKKLATMDRGEEIPAGAY